MLENHHNHFASKLLEWHKDIDRNLPWKNSDDPYKIWLSEIIMQQTRIAQGTPYYLKFVEDFPTVVHLANAEEDQVMKLWQGLGYYSRARNLHFAAKTVRDQHSGIFPSEYKDILALKGIGKYTAAAISSFAFGNEYPVVDGNVIRLISRYFGITEAVDTTPVLKRINSLAEKLIKGSNPADYNQAIMDFGALMCTPKSPNCIECPFSDDCVAYNSNLIKSIPYKSKKIKKKVRYFHFFHLVDNQGSVLLNFRDKKDIWQSLYDFPNIENKSPKVLEEEEIQLYFEQAIGSKSIEITFPTKIYKHILTHQTIFGQFYKISIPKIPTNTDPFLIVDEQSIDSYAYPVLLTNYMKDAKDFSLF